MTADEQRQAADLNPKQLTFMDCLTPLQGEASYGGSLESEEST
jgi:hypothetical protein